jgi:hypothetical protein
MRVNFSLLTDSYDEGASPGNAVRIVLHFIGAVDHLMRYLAVSRSKRQPLAPSAADEVLLFTPQFGCSTGPIQLASVLMGRR